MWLPISISGIAVIFSWLGMTVAAIEPNYCIPESLVKIYAFVVLLVLPRESRVRPNRGSGGEPEHLHLIGVLSFDDEFREDVGCGGIQEKFRHALAQGIGHDQL